MRMQEAWRESVEKDVSCLREVLAQYKEQAERLEMQKKLLLSQVRDQMLCWGGAPMKSHSTVHCSWMLWTATHLAARCYDTVRQVYLCAGNEVLWQCQTLQWPVLAVLASLSSC